jgi:hypothetical protein
MTDLKQRLAVVLASPEGKAMIEDGQQFYIEELQAAFVQVLAQANDHDRVVLEAAINAVIARKAKERGNGPETSRQALPDWEIRSRDALVRTERVGAVDPV